MKIRLNWNEIYFGKTILINDNPVRIKPFTWKEIYNGRNQTVTSAKQTIIVKTNPLTWKDLYRGLEANIERFDEELFPQKVTIYNDCPATNNSERKFRRFVVDRCHIQGGIIEKANGTTFSNTTAKMVITKDIQHYLSPYDYDHLAESEKQNHYTARTGDFIVLEEVDDEVTTPKEFAELQTKYKNCGFKLVNFLVNIYGMENDNISLQNQ